MIKGTVCQAIQVLISHPVNMFMTCVIVALYCIMSLNDVFLCDILIVGTVQCGPCRNQSKLTYSHFAVLIRHKQAQMYLQRNPKCYEQISKKFKKYLIFYCLTHSLTDAFSQA